MRANIPFLVPVLVVVLLGASTLAVGQGLSVGIIGGAGLTQDFHDQTLPLAITSTPIYSTPKRYTGGLMVAFRLPGNLSLEIDGLYRPLGYMTAFKDPSGLIVLESSTVVTWEFPVLAKYGFPVSSRKSFLKPFIELGPSFRTTGNLNAASPSHYGATAGVGMDMNLRGLNIAPVVRYTHWAPDSGRTLFSVRTRPDQVELLVGVSRTAKSDWHPMGGRIYVGAVMGASLTDDFRTRSGPVSGNTVIPLAGGGFSNQEFNGTAFHYSGPKSFIAGPLLELELPKGLSVETEALHRPLRSATQLILTDGTKLMTQRKSTSTWEFPVLAKYRASVRSLKPLIEMGPAFRLPQGLGGGSHLGVAAGAGVEAHLGKVKITPLIRYTHWAKTDPAGVADAHINEAQFLTSFSF